MDPNLAVALTFSIPALLIGVGYCYVDPYTRDIFDECNDDCKHKPTCPLSPRSLRFEFGAFRKHILDTDEDQALLHRLSIYEQVKPNAKDPRSHLWLAWDARLAEAEACRRAGCKHKWTCERVSHISPYIAAPGPEGYVLAPASSDGIPRYRDPKTLYEVEAELVPNPAFDAVAWRPKDREQIADEKSKVRPAASFRGKRGAGTASSLASSEYDD